MGFDAYEQLAVDPGAVGDVARSILETPSQPGESYADTQYRSAQQAGATARIQAIKGKQWAARGVPSYQDMQGNTKPVVDDTGSPLSKLDPKHNIAYDSTGSPKKIDFDIGSGSPVLKDPFEGLETTTDPKTGHQYKIAPGLPWRWVGTDAQLAQKAEFARQDANLSKASAALGRKLTLTEYDEKFHRDAIKDVRSQLKQLSVADTDPVTGDPLDYDGLVAGINSHYDDLKKNDTTANAKEYFGMGGYTPEALKAQQALDLSRTAALRAAAKGHAHAQTLDGIRQQAEAVRAQRMMIEQTRLDHETEILKAQGIDISQPPPDAPQPDDSQPQENTAPDGKPLPPAALALRDAQAGKKSYKIDEKFQPQFSAEHPFDDLMAMKADGLVDAEFEKKYAGKFKEAQDHYAQIVKDAGGASQAKALIHGLGPAAAFMAGFGPGAAAGATVGGGIGAAIGGAVSAPTAGIAAPATVPAGAGIGAGIGSVIGGLAAGTMAAWAAHKAMNALGEYSDVMKSLNAAAEMHPILDEVGGLLAFSTGAPKAIANLSKVGKIANASRAAAIAAGVPLEEAGATGAKVIAAQLAKGAAGGLAFEGLARPGFDATVNLVADGLGIEHEQLQSPTVKSLAVNAALGVLLAGKHIQFKDFNAQEVASVALRGQLRKAMGVGYDAPLDPAQVAPVAEKMGMDSAKVAEMAQPMNPQEAALYEQIGKQVDAMKKAGSFDNLKLSKLEAQQAFIPGLTPGKGTAITSATIGGERAEPGAPEGRAGLGGPEAPTPTAPGGERNITPKPEPTKPTEPGTTNIGEKLGSELDKVGAPPMEGQPIESEMAPAQGLNVPEFQPLEGQPIEESSPAAPRTPKEGGPMPEPIPFIEEELAKRGWNPDEIARMTPDERLQEAGNRPTIEQDRPTRDAVPTTDVTELENLADEVDAEYLGRTQNGMDAFQDRATGDKFEIKVGRVNHDRLAASQRERAKARGAAPAPVESPQQFGTPMSAALDKAAGIKGQQQSQAIAKARHSRITAIATQHGVRYTGTKPNGREGFVTAGGTHFSVKAEDAVKPANVGNAAKSAASTEPVQAKPTAPPVTPPVQAKPVTPPAKPAAPVAEEAPEKKRQNELAMEVQRQLREVHGDTLKALGKQTRAVVAPNTMTGRSGLITKDGIIHIDPVALDKALSVFDTQKEKDAFLERALNEEVKHAQTVAFAQSDKTNRDRIIALNDTEKEIAEGLKKQRGDWEDKTLPDGTIQKGLSAEEKGHEIFRVLLQAHENPSNPQPTTESTWQLIGKFVEWLKAHVKNLSASSKKLLSDLEAWMAKRKQDVAEQPESPPKKSSFNDAAKEAFDGLFAEAPTKEQQGKNFAKWREESAIRRKALAESVDEILRAAGAEGGVLLEPKTPRSTGTKLTVTPDNGGYGKEGWRVTQWDNQGPYGHFTFESREAALRAVGGESHTKLVPGPPYFSFGPYKVVRVTKREGGILHAEAPTLQQKPIPEGKDAAFLTLATTALKDGATTPEALGKMLVDFNPAARAYSQAVWSMMAARKPELAGSPDWNMIYEGKGSEFEVPGYTVALRTPESVPFTEQEMDPNDIHLSKEVPNVKEDADEATGIVKGQELGGEYDRSKGGNRIVIWQRLNGRNEVVTGRHRRELAIRTGAKAVPVQVFRESEGFTREMALTVDAEANIQEGQGKVSDYANYFRHTQISREKASSRGLLNRDKGRSGFAIGKDASDDLYALYRAGKVSDAKAAAIATTAPGDQSLQQIGIKYALKGESAAYIVNVMKAATAGAQEKGTQIDLFGNDDSAMVEMERRADTATKMQQAVRDRINAVRGAVKRPEAAAEMGVDVKDVEGTKKEIARLEEESARWDNWPMHKDLVAKVKGEEAKPAKKAEPKKDEAEVSDEEYFGNILRTAADKPNELRVPDVDRVMSAVKPEEVEKFRAWLLGQGPFKQPGVATEITTWTAEESPVTEYAYGMQNRPRQIGAQPKDFSRVDENDKRGRHGVIFYNRKLTADEIYSFELKDLNAEEAPKEDIVLEFENGAKVRVKGDDSHEFDGVVTAPGPFKRGEPQKFFVKSYMGEFVYRADQLTPQEPAAPEVKPLPAADEARAQVLKDRLKKKFKGLEAAKPRRKNRLQQLHTAAQERALTLDEQAERDTLERAEGQGFMDFAAPITPGEVAAKKEADIKAKAKAAIEFRLNRKLVGGNIETQTDAFGPQEGETMSLFAEAPTAGATDRQQKLAAAAWKAKGVESSYFKKWQGKAELYRIGDDLISAENGKPVVVEGFHGTTRDFAVVDPSKANVQNDMGRGFYVTNTPEDAQENYAGEGPDLTNRLEQKAEQLDLEVDGMEPEEMVEQFGISEYDASVLVDTEPYSYGSPQAERRTKILKKIARKELTQHGGATMKVFVKLENPLKLGENEPYWGSEWPADENGAPVGEPTGKMIDFLQAIRNESRRDVDLSALDDVAMDGMKAGKAIAEAKKALGDSEDDNGDLNGNEIIRTAIERMGYDGILDGTVDEKFGYKKGLGKPMKGVGPSTVHVIAFWPEQVKSATGNRGTFTKGSRSMLEAEAPHPFYSALTKTVQSIPQLQMTVQQARAAIEKGAKKDEIAMSGIFTDPLSPLAGKQPGDKVTKAELTGYALERQATVQDVVLGKTVTPAEQEQYQQMNDKVAEINTAITEATDGEITVRDLVSGSRHPTELNDKARDLWNERGDLLSRRQDMMEEAQKSAPTHFGSYQLPGADEGSYREMFVTWPEGPSAMEQKKARVEFLEKKLRTGMSEAEYEERNKLIAGHPFEGKISQNWNDGHPQYSDIANPIVRIRRNIRTDADGKRTYFIEEMQGPGKGEQEKMPPELRKRIYKIGMKRALRDAVDEGADAIAWTTGEQQAERYDLSKQVDAVFHSPGFKEGTYNLDVERDGRSVMQKQNQTPEQLTELVGKELAAKIVAGEGSGVAELKRLSGGNLKVGGEGLKRVYDQILPAIANDLAKEFGVKKFGVKAGRAEIATPKNAKRVDDLSDAELLGELHRNGDTATVHSLPIPDALKTQQRTQGSALFAEAPEKQKQLEFAGEMFTDAVQLGAHYIQTGSHRFTEWAEKMREDCDPRIEKYLKSIYETAKVTIESPRGESVEGRPPGLERGLRPPTERIVTARAEHTQHADESVIPDDLKPHLDEHQRQGAAAGIASMEKIGGFLNADGTGAGKTRQALTVASHFAKQGKRVVIVTKAETIKQDWKKNTFGGSYGFDSKAMGIPLDLVRDGNVKPGKIGITTYQNLSDVDRNSGPDTVLIFDEAHALKNDSQQAKYGMSATQKASKVMFMSATPADKAEHIYYLAGIGIMEGKTVQKALEDLGMKLVTVKKRDKNGRPYEVKFWAPDGRISDTARNARFSALFNRMTAKGAMIKREISMEGVHVNMLRVSLPPEGHDVQQDILRHFDATHIDDLQGLKRAIVLGHMRRQQEPFKIASTVMLAQRELEQGRQVVIFVSRVNASEVGKWVKGLDGERYRDILMSSEGTAKTLAEAMRDAGIHDIAEIHGNADQNSLEAMADFQSGKKRVVIATIESGGTGINLDDILGNRPRSMIIVTAPFDAVGNVQAAGRIWRLKTMSGANLFYLFGNTDVDEWNKDIIGSKMAMLGAVVEGQVRKLDVSDPEQVSLDDFHSSVAPVSNEGSPRGEMPEGNAFPTLDWRPFKTKAGKDKFVADATPEFWKWWKANGERNNSEGVSLNKWDGKWQVWSDREIGSTELSAAAPERKATDAVAAGAKGREETKEDRKAAQAATFATKPPGVASQIWDAIKTAGSATKRWWGEMPAYDTIDKAIGQWLGAGDSAPLKGTDIVIPGRQKAAHESRKLVETIVKQFPNVLTRQAISRYMEADGDRTTLQKWADKSKPEMKTVYERALNLNAAEKAMADTAKTFFKEKGEEAQKLGLLGNLLENYVTHFVEKAPANQRSGLMARILGDLASDTPASKLKTKFDHAIKRVFASMFDLEQEGHSLRGGGDIAGTLGAYAQAANNTVADRVFVKSLTDIMARDGRPMAVPSGAITRTDGSADSPLLIKPHTHPADTSDYRPISHPALRKWKWLGKEGEKDVLVEGELLIHPDLYKRLKNTLGTSALNNVPIIKAVGEFQAIVKQFMLSFSPFHFVQEGTHAIGHKVNPFKVTEIDMEDPATRELVNAGLMLANWNAKAEFGEGLTASGMEKLLSHIGLGKLGKLNDTMSAFLFERYIPGLKIAMAKEAMVRNMELFKKELASGKMTREQVAQKTAQQANDAFGEQNNLYAGNNPTRLHVERLLFLAPDFLKSRAKFFADAFRKHGGEQRNALILLAVVLAVTAKLLERMLTGKNDWEKPFSVVTDDREYELRSVPGDVIAMLKNTRQFVMGRISPLISRTALEAATGRDWRGQQRSGAQQVKDLAMAPLPLALRGVIDPEAPDISMKESLISSSGLRTIRHSEITKVRKLGREWQKANGSEHVDEVHPPSKYVGIKNALEDGDNARAMKEYGKLLATMPKDKADTGFRSSLMKPFSGSLANEKAFVASLDADDRATYQAAMTKRGRMLAAFTRMSATTRAPANAPRAAAKAAPIGSRNLTVKEFFR
jgi:hypothetical protein